MEPDATTVPEASRPKSKSEIWKEFYESSTLHGLQHAFANKSLIMRFIWLTLVFASLGILIYSVVDTVQRFVGYPTVLKINQSNKDRLPFPAVTICSRNFADKNKLYAKENDSDFRRYNLNISACVATERVRAGRPCGHALACAFILLEVQYGHPLDGCSEEYQQEITNAMSASNVSFNVSQFYRTFSESWGEILRYCVFGMGDKDCSYINFKPVLARDRLCHSFNSKMINGSHEYYSTVPGPTGGLKIVLQHRADRYFYPMYGEGFELYIHEPEIEKSLMGINAAPGKLTAISIEREQFQYLESPYGSKCEDLPLQGYARYSQVSCFSECWNNYVNSVCGCRPQEAGVYTDSPNCYLKDMACVGKSSESFLYQSCRCPLACTVESYRSSVSYGALPKAWIPGVLGMFSHGYSEKEFLYIQVTYGSHRDVVYSEELAFGFISMLGQIGGNMGLLLGCSVLTLAEFVFLLYSLIKSLCNRQVQDIEMKVN